MKLSVIIPAYNAEKTISRCLDSLFASIEKTSYSGKDHVEIICIDDGSRDDTWSILERYARAHDTIRIFHKENGGVGSARNLGLSRVTGDYISWIDADDYVSDLWYSLIYETLLAQHPDCLFFDYLYTADGVDLPRHIRLPEHTPLGGFVHEQSLERELKNFLWNQVFRRDLWKGITFSTDYHMLEDYDVLTHITPKCSTFYHLSQCLYHYVQNENSLTHTLSSDVYWGNIAIVKRRYDQYTAAGLPVSITDYVMQLNGYLYDNSLPTDPDYTVRAAKLRSKLSAYKWHILSDKDMPKTVKVKAIFAILRADGILKRILSIKRRLK